MSAKNTKVLLKEIKDAIKDENYKDAIKKCEDFLKVDPTSYMGHLLMGAAYQNTRKQEAAKYLRKAIEYCSPQPPTVALQGLANCAPTEELPKIYCQLIELVPNKQSIYFEKLYNLSSNTTVVNECFNIFKCLILNSKDDDENKVTLYKYLGRIWIEKNLRLEAGDEQLYKVSLESILSDDSVDVYLPAYKRYIKLLYKLNDLELCLERACNLVDLYPEDLYAYEWICKIYCEHYNSTKKSCLNILQKSIDCYATKLLGLNENSTLGLFVKAIHLYNAQQFVAARELLYKIQNLHPYYEEAIQLLAFTEMHLEAYELAELLWHQFNCDDSKELAVCLSYSDEKPKLNEAVKILKTKELSESIIRALARCFYKLEDIESLQSLDLDPLTKAEFFLSPTKVIEHIQSYDKGLETYSVLFLMGKSYFEVQNYKNALTYILKATRLKPYSSECFYYLGRIYFATNDIVRSRKCFEKCVTLNPLNDKAVQNLSIIYQQLEEEDLNLSLLVSTLKYLKNRERSKHIHYKLGLHYLNVHRCDEAIQSFRSAIKHDVTCIIYWESLGDAYSERGSYNSAIRVFQKVLEMQPNNLYAKLQIAIMKTTVRMFPEAIEDFENLLKENENYLPALKGATEAHIGLATNLKLEYRFGRAKNHLQTAINLLQRCFSNPEHVTMVWLWRLMAKVFVMTAQMPESLANLDVSGEFAKRDTDVVCLTRKDLLNLALRFYTCALKIKQNTYMWYELSLCCYYSSELTKDDAKKQLELAEKSCQMAIKDQPNRWHNWNLLGVIYMHPSVDNLPLAQHCFIQALNIDRKSYTTWTNLGVLYLKLQEIKLANQAFQRAQQSSPIYPNAWIGQAMIAEAILDEIEAVDLYRHCQQFEFHPESSLGYAYWICNILSNEKKYQLPHYKYAINSMHADTIALDAINSYTIIEENNSPASAYSFQGFLSERHNLYRPAVKAYIKAAAKAETVAERDLMYTNLGYVYLKLNEHNEAINAFNRVTQAAFKPIIGLALAYFKAGQHEESYSVYSSVLKSVVGIEDDKAARILVAMASMVYAFQGEADTKTILYQCILLGDSPIQALYSACALGILHEDNQLSETILVELKKYENCEEHVAHIAYLTAQYYKRNQEPHKGLIYLTTRLHIFPQSSELRKVLANFLLDNYGHKQQYHNSTSQISLSVFILAHGCKTKKSNFVDDSDTLLTASKALQKVNKQRSSKLIQRAILLFPSNMNAWNALLKAH